MDVLIRKYNRPLSGFIDQDGPLADFESAARSAGLEPKDAKMQPGFYRTLPLTPGAAEAMAELHALPHLQLFIATKIPDHNPLAAFEKLLWLHEHLPVVEERIIITPNKACLGGPDDFLVDDRAHKADASFFPGTFYHFGTPQWPNWESIVKAVKEQVRAYRS